MKNIINFIVVLFLMVMTCCKVSAVQFDVLVLPTDIFNVCDNYFCFPEPSEIAANYVIQNLNTYKYIKAIDLYEVRQKLEYEPELKSETSNMLQDYDATEKIDFKVLDKLAKEFNVKSVVIISCYATTDRSQVRRNLWEILEVSSAFKITYPFNLTTTAVLTDNVNNVVMWSSKYNKTVSDTNGYFLALNQAQATSHLEKIKQYFKHNVSQNISQNIRLRFFPQEVRTVKVKPNSNENSENTPQFRPNTLEHLADPYRQKLIESDENQPHSEFDSVDDFIFEF